MKSFNGAWANNILVTKPEGFRKLWQERGVLCKTKIDGGSLFFLQINQEARSQEGTTDVSLWDFTEKANISLAVQRDVNCLLSTLLLYSKFYKQKVSDPWHLFCRHT